MRDGAEHLNRASMRSSSVHFPMWIAVEKGKCREMVEITLYGHQAAENCYIATVIQ
jgi:hypothetical protein